MCIHPGRFEEEGRTKKAEADAVVPSESPPFSGSPIARRSSTEEGMEKYHSNTRFAPFRDTPFALRGARGSSNSSFNSMDGLRHSSLEQARGCTSSPLGIVRPKMSPFRSRSLYTSCPLSAPVSNRPLSPHLPLKKPQFSATFSISHRIFGVALGAAIISIPLATKFSLMFDV